MALQGARCFRRVRWPQPEGDIRGLHRLLHHAQQLLAQLLQVHLLRSVALKACQRSGRIILAAIEAPINDRLDARRSGWKSAAMASVEMNDGHAAVLADDAPAGSACSPIIRPT